MTINLDVIYIINLKTDINRKKAMEILFNKYPICTNIVFIEGVDYRNKFIENNYKFLGPPAAYGCTMSHFKCIQHAIQNNYNNILICEDDLLVHNNFNELWNNINIPSDWNIIHLGAIQINWDNININTNFYKSKKTLGGFSYILNKKMFQIIFDYYEKYRLPIDEVVALIQNDYPCYTLFPNLFINFIDKSYIRKFNHWSLSKTGQHFKWNITDYLKIE